jgi:hypothetical protein
LRLRLAAEIEFEIDPKFLSRCIMHYTILFSVCLNFEEPKLFVEFVWSKLKTLTSRPIIYYQGLQVVIFCYYTVSFFFLLPKSHFILFTIILVLVRIFTVNFVEKSHR